MEADENAGAALLRRFDAALLSSDSATRLLEQWCGSPVAALRVACPAQPLLEGQLRRLGLLPGEDIRHRRVKLMARGQVLCVAENWYIPGRLTARMNQALDQTTTPFGHVVAPLQPRRWTLATARLWPNPAGDVVLEHRTLLTREDGQAISIVHEAYTSRILDAVG